MISAVSPEEENVDDLTVVKFIIKHKEKKTVHQSLVCI
jgi:hypothetical protein